MEQFIREMSALNAQMAAAVQLAAHLPDGSYRYVRPTFDQIAINMPRVNSKRAAMDAFLWLQFAAARQGMTE